MNTQDSYSILGITNSASIDAVKTAWRRRCLETHPDQGGDADEFRAVMGAYEAILEGEDAITENDIKEYSDYRAANKVWTNQGPGRNAPDYANLHSHFPFTEMRPGQKEVLDKLQEFLTHPKVRLIIVEAPTGSGKSAFALTCARAAKSAYIATANKMLQEQYLRDFSGVMADLKGRSNYECRRFPDSNCGNAPCRKNKTAQAECSKNAACDYHGALKKASTHTTTSFNFAAFLPFVNYVRRYFDKRNLLVFDEAHMLPEWITNFVELKFSRAELMSLGLASDLPNYESVEYYETFINQIDGELARHLRNDDLDSDTRETLEGLQRRIAMFMRLRHAADGKENFATLKEFDNRQNLLTAVSFKPVIVSKVAQDFLFNHGDKAVCLSATFLDFKTFIDLLGIPADEVAVLRMGSSFPKENRPLITSMMVGQLNQRNLETYLPTIVAQIKKIMDLHPNHKGIIHGGSYKICEYISQNLDSSRLLYARSSKEQKSILQMHLNTKRQTVLLSPSMTAGIDLKDDASRFQIIVKMPYPYLGDPVIVKRNEIYPRYYALQTALTLVQAYGRSVRSETDWANTYILDSYFPHFVNQNRDLFPEWFLEAII